MIKSTYKKYSVAIFLVIFLCVFVGSAHFVQAASPWQAVSCLSNLVTCGTYFISYILNTIVGLLVALGAWLVSSMLTLNNHVVDSPVVQTGFSVALSFANLGFILAIIIIALATILHSQTYGIKKLLWRLVVMAILVNFGLVLSAPIIGFSDSITNYFTATSTTQNGYFAFVDNITGAFAPQGIFANSSSTVLLQAVQSNETSDLQLFIQEFLSLVFGVIFEALAGIALLTLAALLLIRYVYLEILLILLPLAWLCWIFPNFKGQFSTWWRNFIKWSFFPAAATFFIWLAFQTVSLTALHNVLPAPSKSNAADPSALILETTVLQPNVVQNALGEIALLGLMIGGLMAASSLTGKFGGVVVNAAQSASGAVTGYVGKQTKKGARAGFRKMGGENLVNKMRAGQIGAPKVLKDIPVVGGAVDWAAKRGSSIAGRGLAKISDNRAMVDESMKKVPDRKEDWEKDIQGSMREELRMAYLRKGVEKGWVKPGVAVNDGKDITQLIQENSENGKFHAYGMDGEGQLESQLKDKTGLTLHELTAQRKEILENNAGLSFEEQTKKLTEVNDKIDTYNKRTASKDPETLANAFQDADAIRQKLRAEGKSIPVTLEEGSIQRQQEAILESMAKGFSPQNARGLIDAIAKGNNLQHFENAVKKFQNGKPGKFADVQKTLESNADLKRWMQKNAGKALFGNLADVFNIKPKASPYKGKTEAELEALKQQIHSDSNNQRISLEDAAKQIAEIEKRLGKMKQGGGRVEEDDEEEED